MTIELVDPVNFDGLFDILGKAFFALDTLDTASDATVPDELVDFVNQFAILGAATTSIDMQSAIEGVPDAVAGWQDAGVGLASSIAAICEQIVIEFAQADTEEPYPNLDESLAELITQMEDGGDYVDANVVTLAVTEDADTIGDVEICYTERRGDGEVNQNIYAETIQITVTSDTSATRPTVEFIGEEEVSLLAQDFPRGSGTSLSITATDAANSLLSNGDFEDTTIADTPDDWVIYAGTPGRNVFVTLPEVQTVVIANTPVSGHYILYYQNADGVLRATEQLAYNVSGSTVQSELRKLPDLEAITVATAGAAPNYTHTITFSGLAGDVTQLTSLNLLGVDAGAIAATITHATTFPGDDGAYKGRALQLDCDGATAFELYHPLDGLDEERVYFCHLRIRRQETPAISSSSSSEQSSSSSSESSPSSSSSSATSSSSVTSSSSSATSSSSSVTSSSSSSATSSSSSATSSSSSVTSSSSTSSSSSSATSSSSSTSESESSSVTSSSSSVTSSSSSATSSSSSSATSSSSSVTSSSSSSSPTSQSSASSSSASSSSPTSSSSSSLTSSSSSSITSSSSSVTSSSSSVTSSSSSSLTSSSSSSVTSSSSSSSSSITSSSSSITSSSSVTSSSSSSSVTSSSSSSSVTSCSSSSSITSSSGTSSSSSVTSSSSSVTSSSSSTAAANEIRIEIADGIGGNVTIDKAGALNQLRIDGQGIYNAHYSECFSFRLRRDTTLPVYLRIRTFTAFPAGDSIYIDEMAVVAGTELYDGGPWVAVFSGATPAVDDDHWHLVSTNDRAGEFQTWFNRAFATAGKGMLLPTTNNGGTYVADTLIA